VPARAAGVPPCNTCAPGVPQRPVFQFGPQGPVPGVQNVDLQLRVEAVGELPQGIGPGIAQGSGLEGVARGLLALHQAHHFGLGTAQGAHLVGVHGGGLLADLGYLLLCLGPDLRHLLLPVGGNLGLRASRFPEPPVPFVGEILFYRDAGLPDRVDDLHGHVDVTDQGVVDDDALATQGAGQGLLGPQVGVHPCTIIDSALLLAASKSCSWRSSSDWSGHSLST
jgi:hypothetical protein